MQKNYAKKLVTFLYFFAWIVLSIPAQTTVSDSLIKVLEKMPDTKEKVELLGELTWQLQIENNYKKANGFIQIGLKLADKVNYPIGKSGLYRRIGDDYSVKLMQDSAIYYFSKSLVIEEKAKRHDKIASCFDKLATSYWLKNDTLKTITCYESSLKHYTLNKDTLEVKNTMGVLIYYFFSLKNKFKGLEFQQRLIELYNTSKDTVGLANYFNDRAAVFMLVNDTLNMFNYYNNAIKTFTSMNDDHGVGLVLLNLGDQYSAQSNFVKSSECFYKALKIFQEEKKDAQIYSAFYSIGGLYEKVANFTKALEFYKKAMLLSEKLKDKNTMANSYNAVGWAYKNLNNYEQALPFYIKSMQMYEQLNDHSQIAYPYGNLGIVYNKFGQYDKAIEYSSKALEIFQISNAVSGISESYNNIGNAYRGLGDYKKSISFLLKSMALTINSPYERFELANSFEGLSNTYEKLGDFKNAYSYHKRFTHLKDSLTNQENSERINKIESKIDNEKKQKEIELLSKDAELKNVELEKQKVVIYSFIGGLLLTIILIALILRGYYTNKRTNKKLTEINSEILKQKVELEKLSIVASETINGVVICDPSGKIEWFNTGYTRMLGYSLEELFENIGLTLQECSKNPDIQNLIDTSIQTKNSVSWDVLNYKKNGEGIWIQSTLTPIVGENNVLKKLVVIESDITKMKEAETNIKNQNILIEEKNKSITDSINYAKRIQSAILPSDSQMKNLLPEFFVLYKPKDIVSGDFYFYAEKDGEAYFAAADCTGHGVPGAFMSVIGSNLLSEIINDKKHKTPGDILQELDLKVMTMLKQQGGDNDTRDGMDISLIRYNPKTHVLGYSSANRPIFLIREQALEVFTPSKFPIGNFMIEQKNFTNHEVQLKKGDLLYLFTDGYADQFGGDNSKKFMVKRFQQLLVEIQTKPLNDQKTHLDHTFETWKGDQEQVDDILVVGFMI